MRAQLLLRDLPMGFETPRLTCRIPKAGDGAHLYGAVKSSLAELRAVLAAVPWAVDEPSIEASESFCRTGFADFHRESPSPGPPASICSAPDIEQPSVPARPNMRRLLTNRNYMSLLIGKSCSLFGTLALNISLALFVVGMGGSAQDFALVLSISVLPYILISPLAGSISDRVNKKYLLVALDIVRAGWVVLLLVLLYWGSTPMHLVYFTCFLFAVCETFFHPTALSMLPSSAGERDLVDANALWGVADQGIAMGAPVLGAAIYGLFGMQAALILLAVVFSFAAAIQSIMSGQANTGPSREALSLRKLLSDFGDVAGIFRANVAMSLLAFNGFLSHFFLLPFLLIGLPFMILRLLNGTGTEFGIVEGAAAAGSVVAGLLVSRFKHRKIATNLLIGMTGILLPVSLYGLVLVPSFFELLLTTPAFRVAYFSLLSFLVFVSFAFYGGYFGVFFQKELPKAALARGYSVIIMTNGTGRLLGFTVFGALFDAGLQWALLALAIGIILKIITHIPFMQSYGQTAMSEPAVQ